MEQKNNTVRKRLPQIDLYERMLASKQQQKTIPTSPAMDNYLPPSSVAKNESSPKQSGNLQSLMRSYGESEYCIQIKSQRRNQSA